MVHVTAAQFAEYTGRDYEPDQVDAIGRYIVTAENWLRRAAGYDFYNADQQGSDGPAAHDWNEAVCLIVERLWFQSSEKVKTAAYSPFSSERMSDYQYTIVADRARNIGDDPRVAEIVGYWQETAGANGSAAIMLVVGPSRDALPEYDPDLSVAGGDVSRGAPYGDIEP